MPTAERLLDRKGHSLAWLAPTTTVFEAAQLMNDKHIGSVLVLEGGELRGIFTERDVMRRVVAERLDPETTALGEVMTRKVVCAAPHTTLQELRFVMREQRIRHIPVVDNGTVLGIISIGDLNEAERQVQVQTIEYLSSYMSVT